MEYAVYRGDEYITSGTMRDIAKNMNIKLSTVQFYHTPTYKKRTEKSKRPVIFVPLD